MAKIPITRETIDHGERCVNCRCPRWKHKHDAQCQNLACSCNQFRGRSEGSMWIRGDDLTPKQRDLVLRAYGYRWTNENTSRVPWWIQSFGPCPSCDIAKPAVAPSAAGHNHPTVPLISDAEWLNTYKFQFDPRGEELVGKYAEWMSPRERNPFTPPVYIW